MIKSKKPNSWDKRKKIDRANFVVAKKENENIFRAPGKING